eukprot:2090432-Rhodomonas_salina.1
MESEAAALNLVDSGSLSLENLNAELSKQGVDPVVAVKSAPVVDILPLISDEPTSDPDGDDVPALAPVDDKGGGGGGSAAVTAGIAVGVLAAVA